jgi:hypothetical protein
LNEFSNGRDGGTVTISSLGRPSTNRGDEDLEYENRVGVDVAELSSPLGGQPTPLFGSRTLLGSTNFDADSTKTAPGEGRWPQANVPPY